MRGECPVIYYRENGEKMLKRGAFSLFPLLGFSIWIKWGVHEGRQWGQRWWEIGCRRKDILHLPIQSVVFSNFEMKEKNTDGIAPECITADCKVQKAWVRRWRGILHVGHFPQPFFTVLFFDSGLVVPCGLLLELAVTDRSVLDEAGLGQPRARHSCLLVSYR